MCDTKQWAYSNTTKGDDRGVQPVHHDNINTNNSDCQTDLVFVRGLI